MSGFTAFMKKEFCEFVRTYKLLIMVTVFLLLGMMNPIIAKITPMLMDTFLPEGMVLNLPEPSALDSWMQFYKNVPQMGLVILLIVYSGIMANEFANGTLINILTKGLPRKTVILAKFTTAILNWTGAYALCFGVSYVYTEYFWSGANLPNISFAAFCLWLFGVLLLAIVLFGGVLVKSNYGSLLLSGGVVIILYLLNIVPRLAEVNPVMLVSGMSLISGQSVVSDFIMPLIMALTITFLFIVSAIVIFDRKQI